MGRRLQRLAAEGAKFIAVGGVATLIALLLFNLLVHGFWGFRPGPMNDRPLTSYALANLVGMVVSYAAPGRGRSGTVSRWAWPAAGWRSS